MKYLEKAQIEFKKTQLIIDDKKSLNKAYKHFLKGLHFVYKATNKSFDEKSFEQEYLDKWQEDNNSALNFADDLIETIRKNIEENN